jgi:hypothetical protein
MYDSAPFISSCTRRQLARRRPSRSFPQAQFTLMLILVLFAVAGFFALRGGI